MARRRRSEGGFTLIELMVVLTILGLAAAAVVIAMPSSGPSITSEAERFAAQVSEARDRAVLESRPVRIVIDGKGYRVASRSQAQWRPQGERRWNAGTQVDASGQPSAVLRFDTTGIGGPLSVRLERDQDEARVDIGSDGSVRVVR